MENKDTISGLFGQNVFNAETMRARIPAEVYEDLEEEIYKDVTTHYNEMLKVYEKIKGIFYV